MSEYLDVDLVVGHKVGDTYPVWVETPRWGDVTAQMWLDLASARSHMAALAEDQVSSEILAEFGTFLFDALMPRDVTAAFMVSLGHARSHDANLRIRLRLEPPELRPIPWEFLYVPFFHRQLGADIDTALTRSVGVFGEVHPIETKLPLQVLVVAPRGSGLNSEEEINNLKEAARPLEPLIKLEVLDGKVTLTALIDALEADIFHVLHFIGHGKLTRRAGYLEINDNQGGPEGLSEEQMRGIFANHRSMKVAVLNACEGGATLEAASAFAGMAANLVATGIPAVVAHQYPVTDASAITFSRAFYRSLVRGPNPGMVEDAVARARNQLRIEHPSSRVVGATVLYMRGPSGRLFIIDAPTVEEIESLLNTIRAKEEFIEALGSAMRKIPFPTAGRKGELEAAEAELAELRAHYKEVKSRMGGDDSAP